MSEYYPNGRPLWDDQFRETAWEQQERWRTARARRKAEGKCWQCAKLIADCTCPNVEHTARDSGSDSEGIAQTPSEEA